MLLADLVAASAAVGAAAARSRKVELLADALRAAGPPELPAVVAHLSGDVLHRRTGVGWASLRDLPPPAAVGSLFVADVTAAVDRLAALAGPGSAAARRTELDALLRRATEAEQRFLAALLTGELRQGALEALLVDALARAGGAPLADVRRAVMLAGAVGPVAAALLADGPGALARFRLEVGRPVQPMLASPGADVVTALGRLGEAAVEWKLDGVRLQVHRDGGDVAVFTRSLDDVTARLPEVVGAALALPVRSAVLDGEAIALRPDGRPHPFQVTGSRLGTRGDPDRARGTTPLTPYLFDVLHLDGDDLLAEPGAARAAALERVVPPDRRVPRVVTADPAAAEAALAEALARGHEGVVVKSLAVPYEAGRRGSGWLKVKPVHTLDLLVLAAEWGSGRRRGWLSNLHLGARDAASGPPVMLGKTFKGLTDAMLAWQTEHLLAIAVDRGDWVVRVRPELVVEVALDGLQTSSRYPGGVALRFARVVRHRPDKPAAEADTLEEVLAVRG